MVAHVRAPALPATPEKPAVAGGMKQSTYMECMEALRLLMKKNGVDYILDCVKKVKAELSLAANAVEPGVTAAQGNVILESKANEVVPPPKPQLSPLAAKPGVGGEPAVVKANEPPPNLPLAVSAVQYAPIFVVGFSSTMKYVDLQNLFDTEAIIGRFYKKRFGKPVISFAKVLIPVDRIDQVLSQEYTHSVSGAKLRVAKWVESPSVPAQAASPAAGKRRSGRRTRSRKIPSAATASVGLTKEQASFIAKFLAPQARPPSGGMHSRHGERLYSQIVAAVKTVDVRTKFLETTMREMSRVLDLVQLQTDGSL